jgi:hypothetical protein
MAEPKRDVEITLAELKLSGDVPLPKSTRHLADFQLVWPRVTIAKKTTSLTLPLAKGAWSGEGRPWTRRVLFKETVQGSFGIEVTLGQALTDSMVAELAAYMAGTLVKEVGGVVADAVAAPGAGAFAQIPFTALSRLVSKEKNAAILATGVADVETSSLPAAGETLEVVVPLVAESDITKSVPRGGHGASPDSRRVVVKAGAPAGTCRLLLRTL